MTGTTYGAGRCRCEVARALRDTVSDVADGCETLQEPR